MSGDDEASPPISGIAWIFVYVGSLLFLNGAQSGDRGGPSPAQLAVGIALIAVALAVATFLAGLVPLTAVGIWMAHARQKCALDFDGEDDRAVDDDADPVPGIGVDDTRPMGDTPEVHGELSPHDLPKDHPSRRTAEEITQDRAGRFSTTPGHRRGAADPPARPDSDLVDEEEHRAGAKLRP